MRLRLFTVLVTLLMLLPASAAARPPAFHASVTAHERALVRQTIAAARPQARTVFAAVNTRLTFRVIHSGRYSIATCWPADRPEVTDRCRIDLLDRHLQNPYSRSLILWHELGHVVQNRGITSRKQLRALLSPGLRRWERTCTRGCHAEREAWADHFAFFAGYGAYRYSGYRIPRMTSRAKISRFLYRYFSPQQVIAARVAEEAALNAPPDSVDAPEV